MNCVCIIYNFGLLLLKHNDLAVDLLLKLSISPPPTYTQERWNESTKNRVHALHASIYPPQPSLRLNRPLPMTSRRDYPLTSPSRALGPLVIVTSLIGSTVPGYGITVVSFAFLPILHYELAPARAFLLYRYLHNTVYSLP